MGYIDSDTHVIETPATWDYMDPGEERFKPMIQGDLWTSEDLNPQLARSNGEEVERCSFFAGLRSGGPGRPSEAHGRLRRRRPGHLPDLGGCSTT